MVEGHPEGMTAKMPIYEFECTKCSQQTSIFVRTVSSEIEVACPSCGCQELTRLITSFGISKSIGDVHSVYSNPNDPDYYNDPRNIGRSTEDRFAQMGMEMPSQVRHMIDGARDGQMPGSVKDLQPNVNEI